MGLFVIVIAALAASREYSRRVRKRVCECERFLEFIRHIRIQVGCFMRPPSELGCGFSGREIEGFVGRIATDGILTAYENAEPTFSLSVDERDALRELFSSLGSGYLDDELKRIDSTCEKFEKLYNELKERASKDVKLASVLSATAALGVFIIII